MEEGEEGKGPTLATCAGVGHYRGGGGRKGGGSTGRPPLWIRGMVMTLPHPPLSLLNAFAARARSLAQSGAAAAAHPV